MNKIEYRFAIGTDEGQIRGLLTECGLPHEDIAEHLSHFIVATENDSLVGTVGLELNGSAGMLRSLAVAPAQRGKGIAHTLYERLLAFARLHGVRSLYLLTTSAEGFFSALGFERTDRTGVPQSIAETEEFKSLCPSTAVCMTRAIDQDAYYCPREVLVFEDDVPGARQWAVTLENTMLTYFEVDPTCRFETHTHESEQITMVLEGELFFDMGNKTVGVKKGEVIAVPSNLPHAVFTRDQPAKAVDTWSPVMEKYRK